jgi:cysteine synthase A
MQAFGAVVEDVPSDDRGITEALVKTMLTRAHQRSARPGHWWCDQLNNRDAINGYLAMGEEIWDQTGPNVHVAAVEPAESAVLSGGSSGSHKIEGIGPRRSMGS